MRPLCFPAMRLDPATIGIDGYWTLFLSSVLSIGTAGLGLLYFCHKAFRVARDTRCQPTDSYSLMLVPGAALRSNSVQPVFQSRLDRCLDIFNAGYCQSILLLGGITNGNTVSEAQAGAEYLQTRGVHPESVLIETRSQHTLENFQRGRDLIPDVSARLLLLSSRTHLWRCKVFASSMGLEVDMCAAESELRVDRRVLVRLLIEGMYLHWFYTGKLWSRLTANRASLQRIS